MNSTTPLYHALWKHIEQKRSSFHTPGHKGTANLFPDGLLSLDLFWERSAPYFPQEDVRYASRPCSDWLRKVESEP